MTLNEFLRRLAIGELKNLALVEAKEIREEDQETVILYVNEGLKKLYTRFLLKEDDLFLEQRGFITNYTLSSRYALSNYDPDARHSFYINDIGKPFADDVVKVLSVWNRFGVEVPLNKQHAQNSVFTPQPEVLQIPNPLEGAVISVHYQANHPVLSVENLDAEVELPDFLVEGLSSFVAHKVFANIGTQESVVRANDHLKLFETNCVEAVQLDLVTTGTSTSEYRFEKNGWC